MKNLLVLIFFSIAISLSAQEQLIIFENSLAKYIEVKDVLPVVNKENNDIALFLNDPKNIYGYFIDERLNLKNKLLCAKKKRKYKITLGSHIFNNDIYMLFVSNTSRNQFGACVFSVKTDKSFFSELVMDSPEESFIQSFNTDKGFYILSIKNNSSILNIYKLDVDGNSTKYSLDYSDYKFSDNENQKVNLYSLLSLTRNSNGFNNEKVVKRKFSNTLSLFTTVARIDESYSVPFSKASEINKIYIKNNEVLMTFDSNEEYTQSISFNLTTLEKNNRNYLKPFRDNNISTKITNSFIFENYIVLFSALKDKLAFTIYDLRDNAIIKNHILTQEDIELLQDTYIMETEAIPIYTKNANTKNLLKNINSGNIGVTLQLKNNEFELSLGSSIIIVSSPGPVLNSNGSINIDGPRNASTISKYITFKFDKNFNLKDGNSKNNFGNKIKEYEMTMPNDFLEEARTIFKYKGFFIMGNLNYNTNEYILQKFEE